MKTACGSPCYAAPEMLSGKPYRGEMVDIWASGIVLYAMVCWSLQFDEENTSILYKKIKQGEYKLPTLISKSLHSLI